MIAFLRRLLGLRPRCRHVYRGVDIVPRNAEGIVEWPCSICDHVARVEYGLQVIREGGTITGPWGAE